MSTRTTPSKRKVSKPKLNLEKLYAAHSVLDTDTEKALDLQIPFDVYLQDPLVAKEDPMFGFDENFFVKWEPGLSNGPTSARFAVVDYNGDTGLVTPPAIWDKKKRRFVESNRILDRTQKKKDQFHQVNVWAALQRALNFYEEGFGLGRSIPWGFEGNRLIIVPHAGYGQNAFYDRKSKSLQFYYYIHENQRVYTCLSTDIINHEFGHAILDGIRPYLNESISVETAAFHEFIGDLTAVLIILRNNDFRKKLAKKTRGDMTKAKQLAFIAEQFGRTVEDREYLRSASKKLKMSDINDDHRHHYVSQVLTGAMFDILILLSKHYLNERNVSPLQAFWFSIQRMQRMALQPLDLLPPVNVNFKDYALAVLRAEEISNPKDPYKYYEKMLAVFRDREILDANDEKKLTESRYLYERLKVDVFHDIKDISRSRSAAYHFLNDNRKDLYIPSNQDIIISDLYDSIKFTREARRLPKQIILEYIWREDVMIDGQKYGRYNGRNTTMLCGGTLVFDERGNVISWFRKPGTQVKKNNEDEEGLRRRDSLLADIEKEVSIGRIGLVHDSERGILGSRVPLFTTRNINGTLRFELSPHLSLAEGEKKYYTGERKWEISF